MPLVTNATTYTFPSGAVYALTQVYTQAEANGVTVGFFLVYKEWQLILHQVLIVTSVISLISVVGLLVALGVSLLVCVCTNISTDSFNRSSPLLILGFQVMTNCLSERMSLSTSYLYSFVKSCKVSIWNAITLRSAHSLIAIGSIMSINCMFSKPSCSDSVDLFAGVQNLEVFVGPFCTAQGEIATIIFTWACLLNRSAAIIKQTADVGAATWSFVRPSMNLTLSSRT